MQALNMCNNLNVPYCLGRFETNNIVLRNVENLFLKIKYEKCRNEVTMGLGILEDLLKKKLNFLAPLSNHG